MSGYDVMRDWVADNSAFMREVEGRSQDSAANIHAWLQHSLPPTTFAELRRLMTVPEPVTILTVYVPATNQSGQRVIAKGGGAQITHQWNFKVPQDVNHGEAAATLAARLGFPGVEYVRSNRRGNTYRTTGSV